VKGLGETYSSPAFAAAAGLLRWEQMGVSDASRGGDRYASESGAGLFRRVTGWLQENF
jgi:hypothetical protein